VPPRRRFPAASRASLIQICTGRERLGRRVFLRGGRC
jgi:hypothetical protein